MTSAPELVSPFPMFGGKRRIVEVVWPRLGPDVNSYIEPFFASGAMLLGRPGGAGKYETVNDIDGMIVNFWRAVRADPMEVARYADYPILETDVHARHVWLVEQIPELIDRLARSPDYFNPKIAGWWVWGKSCWIGDGWCRHPEWKARPHLTSNNGVHELSRQPPDITGRRGIHKKVPELHGNKGLHAEQEAGGVLARLRALSDRLRHVRVCSGDFERILSSACMGTNPSGIAQGIAPCAVYLDPPYPGYEKIYGAEAGIAERVLAFCKEYGDHPHVRIALSGYDGDYELDGWDVVPWKAHGGYASQSKVHDNENAHRERIWFSPSCIKPKVAEQHTIDDILRGQMGATCVP